MKTNLNVIDNPTPKDQVETTYNVSHREWFEVACVAKACLNNKEDTCLIPCLITINETGTCNKFVVKKPKVAPLSEPLVL